MFQLHRWYQVLALTAERFEALHKAVRQGVGDRPLRIRCLPFQLPADDPSGESGPPPVGLMPLGPSNVLACGPLAYTVFRHRKLEAFFREAYGPLEERWVTVRRIRDVGFRLTIAPTEEAEGGQLASFLFEADQRLDRSWCPPPQDPAFLARSVEAIALKTMELIWDQSRLPWPRVPHLDRPGALGFELAPGLWIALPSHWLATGHRENIVPALILDPERYAWREGADPRHRLLPQNAYLAADLSAYGDRSRWEQRLRQVGEDPDALPTIRQVVADLCVDRATGEAPATIECRPFVWARLVDF